MKTVNLISAFLLLLLVVTGCGSGNELPSAPLTPTVEASSTPTPTVSPTTPTPTTSEPTEPAPPSPVSTQSYELKALKVKSPLQKVAFKKFGGVMIETDPYFRRNADMIFVFDSLDVLIPTMVASNNCEVYGLKPGTCKMTVIADNGLTAECEVEVSAEVAGGTCYVLPGEQAMTGQEDLAARQLRQQVSVSVGAYQKVIFEELVTFCYAETPSRVLACDSDDPEVARVAGICLDGWVVEGLKPGRCTLEIRTADVTVAACEITVTA